MALAGRNLHFSKSFPVLRIRYNMLWCRRVIHFNVLCSCRLPPLEIHDAASVKQPSFVYASQKSDTLNSPRLCLNRLMLIRLRHIFFQKTTLFPYQYQHICNPCWTLCDVPQYVFLWDNFVMYVSSPDVHPVSHWCPPPPTHFWTL